MQPLHEIVKGLPVVWLSVLVLFGADYHDVHGAANVAFALVHLIGVAVVLASFAVAAWGIVRASPASSGRVSRGPARRPVTWSPTVLVIGIAANFAAFLLEVPMEQRLHLARDRPRCCRSAPRSPAGPWDSRILGRKAPAADQAPAADRRLRARSLLLTDRRAAGRRGPGRDGSCCPPSPRCWPATP